MTRPVVAGLALLIVLALLVFFLARCQSREQGRGGRYELCQQRPSIGLDRSTGQPALPTNQWWSSLLSDAPQTLWTQPLAVSFVDAGVELALPLPKVTADAVVSGRTTPLTLLTGRTPVSVRSFGDFHVDVTIGTDGDALTVAQGSPTVWWTVGRSASVRLPDGATVSNAETDQALGPDALQAGALHLALADGSAWTLVAPQTTTWRRDGNVVTATVKAGSRLGVVARPVGASSSWTRVALRSGRAPVTATRSSWEMKHGTVTQSLRWEGGVVAALMPHHGEPAAGLGTFETVHGPMTVVERNEISWSAPLPGVLLGVPSFGSTDAVKLRRATAEEPARPVPAGSYFGPKALGTLASVIDVARRTGGVDQDEQARLARELNHMVTDTGSGDDRRISYDTGRGGMLASPPEFGHEVYNDHHFQFGYLIAAAATLADLDDPSVSTLRPVIDRLVADLGVGPCRQGFPPFRVMNAYLGHSFASGLAPFADGNNQESSSEAVNAWWATARWAAATDQPGLFDAAMAMYATEAATARWYWLGEGADRPAGYEHRVAGIVWGAKYDFATFFDARPASIVGIQLLPFTFGSLYRDDADAARLRWQEGSERSGDHWADLLALELAIDDPEQAASILTKVTTREEGTSAAFAEAWTTFLSRVGRVDHRVVADPPLGLGFIDDQGSTNLVAVNPWPRTREVVFRRNDRAVAVVKLKPGEAVTVAA